MISFFKKQKKETYLKQEIRLAAEDFKFPFDLIAAIVFKESKGQPKAARYEPLFFTKYIQHKTESELGGFWPNVISRHTERMFRSTSWGLMQVMGQVARERGFPGDYLTDLCDIPVGLKYGCSVLKSCIDTQPTLLDALARYNGNPKLQQTKDYAQSVLTIMECRSFEAMFPS